MDGELELTVSKQRKKFIFSRNHFYLLLSGFYFIPQMVWMVCAFLTSNDLQKSFSTGLFLSALGALGMFALMKKWEKKMQLSVSALVQAKIKHVQADTRAQEENQFEQSHQKIEELTRMLDETARMYEHQIDLLHSSSAKSKQNVEELLVDLERKEEEIKQLSFALEEMKKDFDHQMEKQFHLCRETEESLRHKESLLSEYHHTISEQRVVIEKKQRYIAKLEGKIHDLMYEIRSLLQLEEPPRGLAPYAPFIEIPDSHLPEQAEESFSSHSGREDATPYDLALQLHRYIQMAQDFTGADHLGYVNGKSPRFSEMSFDSYAIDLRRLFDVFREESGGIVFVYSQLEERFLFINNFVRTVLGWSSEKFMKDFSQLIEMGYSEWLQAMAKLPSLKEAQVRLVIRSKMGEEILFQCFMGLVSQGPFANHVIGILAPHQ